MDIQNLLDDVAGSVQPLIGQGEVASYIPSLGTVPIDRFGISLATASGEVYSSGDSELPFSIQSISKVFALALVLAGDGDRIWSRVYREPSGNPFNSLIQLELEEGIPRNPFINAGALVVTDRLLSISADSPAPVRELLRRESGNGSIRTDPEVVASEAATSHRNASLAHFLASYGNLENPVESVLAAYIDQCSLTMSCTDLAVASLFLARSGVGRDGTPFLSPSQAKRINAVMLTCGTYDAAGEFAYRVGVPGKSGVGGGIIAVMPNNCTVCVWSPGLGRSGNSLVGIAALDELTTRTGWSIF